MVRTIESHSSNHRVMLRYAEILRAGDADALGEVLDPDYIQVIPQSREVVRGIDNYAHIMRNWPAGETLEHPQPLAGRVVAAGEHDLVTPGAGFFPRYSVIRVDGEGDTLTAYLRTRYEDGSEWYVVSIAKLRKRKIVKEIMFFAPTFEQPEWRTPWADIMSPDDEPELLGYEFG